MSKRLASLALASTVLLIALGGPSAQAQKTTERFIPIGESPGVSGKYSVIGIITAYDAATQTVTVRAEDGTEVSAKITEDTEIWLDRSEVKKTNLVGEPDDCHTGRRCEVKFVYEDETRLDEADWIKIETTGDG